MTEANRGLFITVEGCEGVGKSTNIQFITDALKRAGVEFILTREPGGTPLAEDIRQLLLTPREESVAENAELLLMFAARAQHIAQVIEPALAAGKWVICDRFTDSTFAYQGGGRGISMQKIADLEQWVQGDLRPSYTLLLDADIEVGMARANKRGKLDRFEQEQRQFFENVRSAYLAMAQAFPQRYRVINAGQALEQVQLELSRIIVEILSCANKSANGEVEEDNNHSEAINK
jgi:dTMP kinase